jgi:hypothetical protein
MIRLVAIFTTLLLLGAGAPALAQNTGAPDTGERILDTLDQLLRGGQASSLTGHVVVLHDNELVLRGRDGKTYVVNTAGVDQQSLASVAPGQEVSVSLRPGQNQTLIADAVKPAGGTAQTFRTTNGTVQSVSGTRVTFRTAAGMTIPVDLSHVAGPVPSFQANQPATLYYEPQAQSPIVAVWLEPQAGLAASPPTTATPSTGTATGAYQRIHGYVQSIGVGTLALKSDTGQVVTVDTSRVGDQARQGVQPGDVVSVVGKVTGTNELTADVIERDASR